MKKLDDAQNALRKAMRWNPANADIAFEHAETFKMKGDIETFFHLTVAIFQYAFKPHQVAHCYEMSKCLIKDKNGKYKLNKRGEILALERARLIAGAGEKLLALRQQITPYKNDNNILVYCGATNVTDEYSEKSSADEEDVRQIEAVINILGNELGMSVARFTSLENIEVRGMIKEQFQRGDRLQAIVAIKCLDEGVKIPGIRTAFILASTTNPKEYIQRRGKKREIYCTNCEYQIS